MTRRARKRDFRGGSISEFFNTIDVNRSLEIAGVDAAVGGKSAGRMGNAAALVNVHCFGSPALFNPWVG
jgi:hypothetical protein